MNDLIPAGFDSLLITQLPNVRYLTGFTGSAGCVFITRRGRKLFFTDFRYSDQAAQQVKGYEVVITQTVALHGACQYIAKRRLKPGVLGFEASHLVHTSFLMIRKMLKPTGARLKDAGSPVETLRQVKTRSEIARIKKACTIADHALEGLTCTKVTGKTEKQIAWLLESTMKEAGSGELPFEIIVASGPRSAMPHGAPTSRVIRKNELIVVDLGASVDGYCSDMTRTFATGKLTQKQREIYETVKEAQQLALEAAKPGAACASVDATARDLIATAGYGEAFGHSLGHGVGLEAHEGPTLAPRSNETLAPGMTITIEPGIYITRTGGVRIEDTVLIGARGPAPLTGFPRKLMRLR